jgi:hypothetical protein
MKRRTNLVIVLAFLAHAAYSQSPTPAQPSLPSAAFSQPNAAATKASAGSSAFYILMFGNSESASASTFWSQRLGDPPLTPAELEQLMNLAKYARDTNLAFQHREMGKMCAMKDSLTTFDAVADALTSFSAKNAANIEQLGGEAIKDLGDKLGGRVMTAAAKSSIMVQETDHRMLMTTMKKEPIAHIQSVCAKSSSPSSP